MVFIALLCGFGPALQIIRTERIVPKRIKRTNFRAKLPANTKLVTRPTRWANPFRIGDEARDNRHAQLLFRRYLADRPELVEAAIAELHGYHLACYCDLDQPCHADVWLEVVNSAINGDALRADRPKSSKSGDSGL